MDITPFLPLITGALGGAASAGAFAGPIKTFQDWWYVNYGYDLSEQAALLQTKQEVNVEKLKEASLSKVIEITPENIQEPQLKILGPALEASRFYIEEEEIRDMFANLIGASMDSSKNPYLHSSFVEIVKQLSSNDANILKFIFDENMVPFVNLQTEVPNGGIIPEFSLVTPISEKINSVAASINNLERLGLLSTTTMQFYTDKKEYDFVKSYECFNLLSTEVKNDMTKSVRIEEGIIQLTNFGKNFCRICLQ